MRKQAFDLSENIHTFRKHRLGNKGEVVSSATEWKEGITGLGSLLPRTYSVDQWRIAALLIIIVVGFVMLITRLFILQAVRGREYFMRAERNRVYTSNIFPERGIIYDRHNTILARNIPIYSLGFIYAELPRERFQDNLDKIKSTFNIHDQDLDKALEYAQDNPYSEVFIKRSVSHEEQLSFKVQEDAYPGFFLKENVARFYPQGEYFTAILGYTGIIDSLDNMKSDPKKYAFGSIIGKDGVEKQYEGYLSGELGKMLVEVEATGKVVEETLLNSSVSGQNLVLTIDREVQVKLGELLEEAIKEYNAWAGSAIIMNPYNGEIYAMISLPTYDNNVFTNRPEEIGDLLSNPSGLFINRAISGIYAPGSTVKMAIAAQALQTNLRKHSNKAGM